MRSRGPGTAAGVLSATVVVVAGLIGAAPASHAASTVTVSGYVFRDLDNDGVRDAGEPGVPGVRVHRSTGNNLPNAFTAADGSYTLTGVTPTSSGYLVVKSGWFRSQCAKLTCAAGPGPDNDYATANAFIQYPLSQITGNTTNLDVGLLPDWPGSSAAPPPAVGGVIPANAVDVAARLSWARSTCPGGVYNICGVGDTFTASAQIHNQGTTALTGITGVLDLPAGDRFATSDPAKDVTLVAATSSPAITGITVSAVDPTTQSVSIALSGELPPGGAALISANGVVVGGPGTPGCVVNAMTSACPKGEPQGAPLTLRITHIDQQGDPDSFGPDCLPTRVSTDCATGIHDKQVEPDEVDPVGHNVAAGLGGAGSYNLSAELWALSPLPPQVAAPGSTVVWRASVFNDGPATGVDGWKLTLIVPKGFTIAVPPANAVEKCAKSATGQGYPVLTCTGKGPLSPGVRSFAIDVSTTVSSTTGTQRALAYVTPASGQGTETNPLGTPPSSPTQDASSTATDNDASASITVSSARAL
jgi:SdrD B-like domain